MAVEDDSDLSGGEKSTEQQSYGNDLIGRAETLWSGSDDEGREGDERSPMREICGRRCSMRSWEDGWCSLGK